MCPFMALTDRNITQFAGTYNTYSFLPFFAYLLNLVSLIIMFNISVSCFFIVYIYIFVSFFSSTHSR